MRSRSSPCRWAAVRRIALVLTLAAAYGGGWSAPEPAGGLMGRLTLSSEPSRSRVIAEVGQAIDLRARWTARKPLPKGARIEIRTARVNETGTRVAGRFVVRRRVCAPGLRTCALPDETRRVPMARAFRALVMRNGRVIAQSRPVLVLWRTPAAGETPSTVSGPVVPDPSAPIVLAPPNDVAPKPPPAPPFTTVNVAGDLAACHSDGTRRWPGEHSVAVAALLRRSPSDAFVTPGDHAYEDGTALEFRDCYEPTFGFLIGITYPAPGNHDYRTPGAAGYFGYFGARAGNPTRGYYSYDLGSWHFVSLNSEISASSQPAQWAHQLEWLRADLAAGQRRCTAAVWHQPAYSNQPLPGGGFRDAPQMRELLHVLYEHHAEVVLLGHSHTYQRWAEIDPAGNRASGRGIRQFVVGTGGAESHPVSPITRSEEVVAGSGTMGRAGLYGLLRLTLSPNAYSWTFVAAEAHPFTDSGEARCH